MAYCGEKGCTAEFYNGKWQSAHKPGCPADGGQLVAINKTKAPKTKNEDKKHKFMTYWKSDWPQPESEYRFCAIETGGIGKGSRKRLAKAGLPDSRFDWAWPQYKIAVEVDGNAWGVSGGGRHMQDTDLHKLNNAILLGWRVFRFSPKMLDNFGQECAFRVLFAIVSEMIQDARAFQDEIKDVIEGVINET